MIEFKNMKEDRIQKTVYLTSLKLSDQIQDVMKVKGFGSFSGYVNHLIANDIHNPLKNDFSQIERTYKANIKMYRDFSFSLIDAKESAKNICLIQFDKKFESFIKNLD